jgi:hypothetical protein
MSAQNRGFAAKTPHPIAAPRARRYKPRHCAALQHSVALSI